MRHLRIKEHASKLSELKARDPSVEKAAVFVERLYGRPLRSDPDVLVITEENKASVLDALRADLPNAVVVHSPFTFLSKKSPRERLEDVRMSLKEDYPDADISRLNFAEFSYKEMLSLESLLLKMARTWGDIRLRATIEGVAWVDDPSFLKRMRSAGERVFVTGLHVNEPDLIILNGRKGPEILVHELIHAEDTAIFGRIRPGFGLMVAEGRAKFGETLFQDCEGGSSERMDDLRGISFYGWMKRFASDPAATFRFFRGKGLEESFRFMKSVYDFTVGFTGFGFQRLYLPFATELIGLSADLGDPYAAFQITTAKPPTRLAHIYRSSDYYSEEVSRRRQAKG